MAGCSKWIQTDSGGAPRNSSKNTLSKQTVKGAAVAATTRRLPAMPGCPCNSSWSGITPPSAISWTYKHSSCGSQRWGGLTFVVGFWLKIGLLVGGLCSFLPVGVHELFHLIGVPLYFFPSDWIILLFLWFRAQDTLASESTPIAAGFRNVSSYFIMSYNTFLKNKNCVYLRM